MPVDALVNLLMSFLFVCFRCLKFLGSRHPTLVLPLVPELLSTHPFFDTAEPDMDDPACILVLISEGPAVSGESSGLNLVVMFPFDIVICLCHLIATNIFAFYLPLLTFHIFIIYFVHFFTNLPHNPDRGFLSFVVR